MIVLKEPLEFDWDSSNEDKNWKKHFVSTSEAEEVFLDDHKRIAKDYLHSTIEDRYILIGRTKTNRRLFIVFTFRIDKVRVISARDMSTKENEIVKGGI